ncbi:MSHA biogenesis protein MshK [Glaciimonas sp. GG7]
MAQSMKLFGRVRTVIVVSTYVLLWMQAPLTCAQTMLDPTQPPDAIRMQQGDLSFADAGPVLQSILNSPGRKVAIISGQTVELHQKFGDFRLIHIGETDVVLQNGKSTQTIKLYPAIQKKSGSLIR